MRMTFKSIYTKHSHHDESLLSTATATATATRHLLVPWDAPQSGPDQRKNAPRALGPTCTTGRYTFALLFVIISTLLYPPSSDAKPLTRTLSKPRIDPAADAIGTSAMALSAASNPTSTSAGITLTATTPSINDPMEAATSGVETASHQPSFAGTGPPMVVSTAAVVNAASSTSTTAVPLLPRAWK